MSLLMHIHQLLLLLATSIAVCWSLDTTFSPFSLLIIPVDERLLPLPLVTALVCTIPDWLTDEGVPLF